jgi:alanine dehydrogenase
MGSSRTPHLITEDMVKSMKKASVILDISIDQGGVSETSRPTTTLDPVYIKHGVLHHCVPNIPSAVARTATYGLTNAALPYIKSVAGIGLTEAMEETPGLSNGVCTLNGKCIKESLRTLYKI